VRNRIVRGLSIGYSIDEHQWPDNQTMVATKWTPMETSVVSVPADVQAGFFRSNVMSDENSGADGHSSRSQRAAARRTSDAELAAAGAERSRAAEIASMAQRHGMAHRLPVWLSAATPLDEIREEILEARDNSRSPGIRASTTNGIDDTRSAARTPGSPIPLEELRNYSLLRAIRSQLSDDRRSVRDAGFELEVSRTLADHCDRAPKGLMVPDEVIFGNRMASRARAVRSLSTGIASAGGDLVALDLLAGEMIETLNNEPQIFALGARRLAGLVGNVAIPRMTAGSAVHWIGEGDDYGDTAPTFDQPQLTPHDLAARVDITRRLLIQSTPAADEIVRSDLALRIGIGVDQAAIAGIGSGFQPTGLLNTAGVGIVPLGANGAAPAWGAITEVIEAVAAANGLRGNLGWLVNGSGMGTLMRTPVAAGFPRFIWEAGAAGARPDEGSIAGYRALVSNNVPGNLTKGSATALSALIFGNWADMMVGLWRGIDLLVDPYSQSSTGTVRITAIQTCDILIRHPQSFCIIADAITS
jgi:HK97 family phage major capsid protein